MLPTSNKDKHTSVVELSEQDASGTKFSSHPPKVPADTIVLTGLKFSSERNLIFSIDTTFHSLS
jgi:hypothetical protein